MAFSVPLFAKPSQVSSVQLGGQSCTVRAYQKSTGLYLDLLVNDAPVILGRLCLDRVLLVRSQYLGFAGDLVFNDTAGTSDPDYTGLGDRFVLYWLEP